MESVCSRMASSCRLNAISFHSTWMNCDESVKTANWYPSTCTEICVKEKIWWTAFQGDPEPRRTETETPPKIVTSLLQDSDLATKWQRDLGTLFYIYIHPVGKQLSCVPYCKERCHMSSIHRSRPIKSICLYSLNAWERLQWVRQWLETGSIPPGDLFIAR